MGNIEIVVKDITTLDVDAIVNAANESLLGGGGIDFAIHKTAGYNKLHNYCKTLNGCKTGQAKITPGFNLPAQWIIHAVGPIWNGGKNSEAKLLEDCYRNSLQLALKHNIKTIAFPAISTGLFFYPKNKAAKIALKVIKEFTPSFDKIICSFIDENDAQIYRDELAKNPVPKTAPRP